ncbi:hypothetical protein CK203_043476 [Vitis vinifera]|uniref:Uncharacterized protein n=1 Tax=Vitis vinifera TaxID=29760 RepID=A0A438HR95_VITVI|nr:hypothetical protein CK203_043476 [Vitis vinifera]
MEMRTSFGVTTATSLNMQGKCVGNSMEDYNPGPDLLNRELETKLEPKLGRLIKQLLLRNPKRPYSTKMTLIG